MFYVKIILLIFPKKHLAVSHEMAVSSASAGLWCYINCIIIMAGND